MDPRIARLAPDLEDYWSPGEVLQPSRTTPKIVRPGHSKYDLEYSIKELKPTYVKSFDWHNQSVLDWAKNEYVRVNYVGDPKEVRWEEDKSVPWEEDKRVSLNLLRHSQEVRWDKVHAAVQAGEASTETPK
jgi:hypothetical protein